MRAQIRVALAVWAVAWGGVAHADTLSVGSGQRFATPCEAVAQASAGDAIEIAAGTYTDSCALGVAGITLRGVGGKPKIDLSGSDHPAQYKAIYVVTAPDVSVENLELTGAHVSADNGANAAALRIEAAGLRVSGCDIHDNQNGILGGSTGTVTIEHSVFFNNGLGDGCNGAGCTHNVYIGEVDRLLFRFNWSHHVATDTDDKGHLLKSRAKQSFVLYNRLTGEDGYDSYEIDLPNGGLAVVVGNVVQKGPKAGNTTVLSWGEEGVKHPDTRVFLIHNTFVSELGTGRFVNVKGAELSAQNNLFVGAQGVMAPADLPASNLVLTDGGFVDAGQYDYHLLASSPARGHAQAVSPVDDLPVMPESEYVHPAGQRVRPGAHDVGAFEYAEGLPPTDADAGVGDAGLPAAGRAAGSAGRAAAGAGRGGSGAAGAADGGFVGSESAGNGASTGGGKTDVAAEGCGCSAPGTPGRGKMGWLALGVLAGLGLWRRSRSGLPTSRS